MFGIARYLLAVMVALGHADLIPQVPEAGIFAVTGFYLISGYVMTALVRANYPHIKNVKHFYFDRFLRLWPAFAVVLVLTLAWQIYYTVIAPHAVISWLNGLPTLTDIIQHLLIVPLDYHLFNLQRFPIIPPAWSLGAEVQFYLVLPFLLLSYRTRAISLAASLCIFMLASFGIINGEYGFQIVWGTLFVFLIGSTMYDLQKDHQRQKLFCSVVILLSILLFLVSLVLHNGGLEVLAGIIMGVPTLYLLSHIQRNKIDDFFGNLSYGVFLSHFLIIHAVFQFHIYGLYGAFIYITSTSLFALTLYYSVEKPLLWYRKRYRVEKPPAPAAFETAI